MNYILGKWVRGACIFAFALCCAVAASAEMAVDEDEDQAEADARSPATSAPAAVAPRQRPSQSRDVSIGSGADRGWSSGGSSTVGGAAGGVIGAGNLAAIAPEAAGAGRASRIFAGPGMFPPDHFAAYAIIAFKSRPLTADRDRFKAICMGYVAAILLPREIDIPLDQQLVTVWPMDHDPSAIRAMEEHDEAACDRAVDGYGLAASLQALRDARNALEREDIELMNRNEGPFVLAWSPTRMKGEEDALILRMDLSGVVTAAHARERFEAWRDEVEARQDLWIDGWHEERLADVIGSWADRWGGKVLSFIGGRKG